MSNLPMLTWLQIEVMKMQSIEMHCFLLLCLANIELPKKICPKLLMLINIPLGRPYITTTISFNRKDVKRKIISAKTFEQHAPHYLQ